MRRRRAARRPRAPPDGCGIDGKWRASAAAVWSARLRRGTSTRVLPPSACGQGEEHDRLARAGRGVHPGAGDAVRRGGPPARRAPRSGASRRTTSGQAADGSASARARCLAGRDRGGTFGRGGAIRRASRATSRAGGRYQGPWSGAWSREPLGVVLGPAWEPRLRRRRPARAGATGGTVSPARRTASPCVTTAGRQHRRGCTRGWPRIPTPSPSIARPGAAAWVRPVALVVACLIIGFVGGWVLRGDDGPTTVLEASTPAAASRSRHPARRRPRRRARPPLRRPGPPRPRLPPPRRTAPRSSSSSSTAPTPPGSRATPPARPRASATRASPPATPRRTTGPSVVYYREGQRAAAERVATDLEIDQVRQLPGSGALAAAAPERG